MSVHLWWRAGPRRPFCATTRRPGDRTRMSDPVWLRRLSYRVRWGRYFLIVLGAAVPAMLVRDEGIKFSLGVLAGIVASRFAMIWTEP